MAHDTSVLCLTSAIVTFLTAEKIRFTSILIDLVEIDHDGVDLRA